MRAWLRDEKDYCSKLKYYLLGYLINNSKREVRAMNDAFSTLWDDTKNQNVTKNHLSLSITPPWNEPSRTIPKGVILACSLFMAMFYTFYIQAVMWSHQLCHTSDAVL